MALMLLAATLVVGIDQISKAIVSTRLPEGAFTARNILGIRLRHVVSRRAPWRSRRTVLAMGIVWLLATAAAALASRVVDSAIAQLALGGLVGGASGNLIDAFTRRAVTDFIDLRVWPVFNIADAAIVSGALLLVSRFIHAGG